MKEGWQFQKTAIHDEGKHTKLSRTWLMLHNITDNIEKEKMEKQTWYRTSA